MSLINLSRALVRLVQREATGPTELSDETCFVELDRLFETISEAIFITDLSGIVKYWNPGAEMLHGYSLDDALGRSVLDLIVGPEGVDEEKRLMKYALRLGLWSGQCAHRRKDGSLFLVDRRISIIRDIIGCPAGFISLERDITSQKNLENELSETRELLRLIVGISPASLFFMEPEGRIVSVNQKLADTFNLSPEEIIGRNIYELISPEVGRSRRAWVEKVLETKERLVFEDERNGRVWEHHLDPVLNNDGQVVYLSITTFDLTEPRKRETFLHSMTERLNQSQKMEVIGSLSRGIAHDFNNIIWGILGFAEMTLKELPVGDKAHENVVSIIKASKRAKDLVEQILTHNWRTGTIKIPVPLNSSIEEAVKFMRQLFPSSVEIQCNLTDNVCTIISSTTKIHQIILNICYNARQALRDDCGSIGINLARVCLMPGYQQGDDNLQKSEYARLSISDTGLGIEESLLEDIFTPFFTTKPQGEGTGLGLSTVRDIVRSHNGFIEVESRVGQGSTFIVYLPLSGQTIDEDDRQITNLPRGCERILFVDDEVMLVQMVSCMLNDLGYDVVSRTEPLEAYTDFENDPDGFDLVILDYTMPTMIGLELARRIKAIRSDIPVILIPGNTPDLPLTLTEDDLAIGYFLNKPMSVKKIAMVIRQALDEKA